METMSAYRLTSLHAARIMTKHGGGLIVHVTDKKTGQLLWACDLAKEYGFTNVDGRCIPRFHPAAPMQAFPC